MTKKTGRSSFMRQALSDSPVCMYNTCTASVIAEPPPPHVAPTPVSSPVTSNLAYVPTQPWPPPVTLVLSAIKPGVYIPLSEGFQGGREISNTLLSLYFRSVI